MKKYLFFLPVMLFASFAAFAQSTKLADLVYFTNLKNSDVYSVLLGGSSFRQDYSIDVNGQEIEYFKNITEKRNTEKIIVGNYTKLYNGTVLRTVDYTSTDPQHIINMIGQAKNYGLNKTFQGADESNNIYIFDNSFYHVSIYLRRDQSSGLVEIKQKEYMNLD